MVNLSLKVRLPEVDITKTIQINSSLLVYDACKVIRERFHESATFLGKQSDYGLFQNDEDARKGRWLDPNRSLEFYLLRNNDSLDYKKKIRQLKVKMLDGSIKTLMIDESETLKNLLPIICAKIGLTNFDEYDLVRGYRDEEKENGTLASRRSATDSAGGTLKKGTLSRDSKDQKKMDKLKQKLATDDDVAWVDQSKTLIAQGIELDDLILLKRRYFYSDQNIDARDPVQLNLLYVQCRDAIINGTHPVTLEQALQFAGLQAQAEFGNFGDSRQAGIDMRAFMPRSYQKSKADRRFLDEWNSQRDSNELNAKVKYIQLARSLKTYGVTFFLVQEKMKGRNKLVPRLFGVTRNSCMRLDEKTKETLTTWPLTQVKRWAASPNTFTLDFGDYTDDYFSVKTQEGERIAQLIAGYIDIILKRQKPKDHFGIGAEEGCTLEEDEVLPAKISVIQPRETKVEQIEAGKVAMPGIIRDINHEKPIRAIEAAKKQLVKIVERLEKPVVLPPIGEDPAAKKWVMEKMELNKQNVGTQMAQITKNVAQVVNLTAPPAQERDHAAVDRAINTIADNLDEMVDGIKIIAALTEDPRKGDDLLDAAKKLCKAFSDLLDAAKPGEAPRQEILTSATKVGEAAKEIVDRVDPLSVEFQDGLVVLAKGVANATASLVRKAKLVASATDDMELQSKIIAAATATALSTSELVATAKVLLPTINSPECQDQLVDAVRKVAKTVQDLLDACKISGVEKPLLEDLNEAAAKVTDALNELLGYVKQGPEVSQAAIPHAATMEVITESTRTLCQAPEPAEMIRQAKILAQATAELVKGLKSEAEGVTDKDLQRRLLAASKQLAEATTRLVEAAKLCAASPQDPGRRQAMRDAAVNIEGLAQQSSLEEERISRLKKLESAAKRVASASSETITAAKSAGPSNANQGAHGNLLEQCRIVVEQLGRLIGCIKQTSSHPHDQAAITELIHNCEDIIFPAEDLVGAAKAALPTVQDQQAANRLRESAGNLSMAVGELRSNLNRIREVHVTTNTTVESAMTVIQTVERDLDAYKRAAQNGNLMPLPEDSGPAAASRLQNSAKQLSKATVQLLNASSQADGSYVVDASQDVAKTLQDLSSAARGVAASVPDDRESQLRMLDSARDVADRTAYLVDSVRDAFSKQGDPAYQSHLVDAAREVAAALDRCLKCLPDKSKDITNAIRSVEETTQKLYASALIIPPRSNLSMTEIQIQLNDAAAYLNEAAGDIVTSTTSTTETLGHAAERYTTAYHSFIQGGMQVVSTETENQRRQEIVRGLGDVSSASHRLLTLAKQTHGQPHAPQMKNQLTAAARAVTESINGLLNYCASSLPSQKECDNAIRRIQQLRTLLDTCAAPVNERTYYESLDAVLDSSRVLGDGMAGISNSARYGQNDEFIQAVRTTSDAVSALIENAAQAAYLIGISDPSSVVGKAGIIDHREMADAVQGIQDASRVMTSSAPATQQQMLQAATVIAKYSHTLCSSCRTASSRSSNPVAKRQFVQSAKDIATSTANMVRSVKTLDSNFTDQNRQESVTHINSLLRSVNELSQYAASPEFAGSAGQLSTGGRKVQEPIIVSGKCIIDASSSLILAAKSLSVNARDPAAWQALTSQSNNVSDSVKSLASSIRDRAPGQLECNDALEHLHNYMRYVDKASLAATSQNLPPRKENTTEGFYEVTINTSIQITNTITSVREAAKNEAESLGHRVSQMTSLFQPLVTDGIGSASRAPNSRDQMDILNHLKTVLEAAVQFVEVSKACGGNPRTRNLHGDLNDSADGLAEAMRELAQTLEKIQSDSGFVKTMINNVSSAISKVDQRIMGSEESYADYQTRMFRTIKEITHTTHEISEKSHSNPQELGNLAQYLYGHYNQLAEDSRGAQGSCASDEISQRIRSAVQDLGHSIIDLIKVSGSVQSNPSDTYIKDELSRSSKLVIERVSHVLSALQAGSRGTQACINAASTVSGVIGDLDTCIMFATAGTLQADDDSDRFADHREDILKTAKALVEDTKTLVTGAASSQEQLAVAAQNAVKTIIQLADVVKSGAASLGRDNSESQVLLINAVRDVASALAELIYATKSASGKSQNEPAMIHLKDSAKIMVTNVTSLLKTVKTVEDEHARGTRALEATIEALHQEIRVFDSSESDGRQATAEDLLRATRPVTQATYKAVTAGKTAKQDDAIIAANMGRKAVADLLITCKAAANTCESPATRNQVLSAGRDCALKFRELLHTVHMILTRPEAKSMQANLVPMTQSIASAVALIAAAAENMKDADGWVNPEDPTVIAENELMGAAATIDHAAKRLRELRPRRDVNYKVENQMMNFDELILEACMAITEATASLIKAACSAQAELVSEGRVSSRPLYSSEDGQWSDGLISAARTVAAACHNLCEAANALVQGHATEEKLISSAKQVASSTAQLLVACRVKSDSNSASMYRLHTAGNAVKKATDNLVQAAQESLDATRERTITLDRRRVGGIAQEISANEDILIKERELEEARGKLLALRKAKYGERASDDEYYGYGTAASSYSHQTETKITETRYTSGPSGYTST